MALVKQHLVAEHAQRRSVVAGGSERRGHGRKGIGRKNADGYRRTGARFLSSRGQILGRARNLSRACRPRSDPSFVAFVEELASPPVVDARVIVDFRVGDVVIDPTKSVATCSATAFACS